MALSVKAPKKVKKTGSGPMAADMKVAGFEPVWDDLNKLSESDLKLTLIQGYSWYTHFYAHKDAVEELLVPYLKAQKMVTALKAVNKVAYYDVPVTTCYMARIMTKGGRLTPSMMDRFNASLKTIIEKAATIADQTALVSSAPKVTIRDRVEASARELLGEIDGFIDEFILNGYKPMNSFSDFIRAENVKAPQAKIAGMHLNAILSELKEISCDDDVKYAYRRLTKAQIKSYISYIESMIADLGVLVQTAKTASVTKRKPRAKKEKSVQKVLEKFQFKASDTELQIASIPPQQIIGAQLVLYYNCAQQKIGMLVAEGPSGLRIERSSVRGFSETESMEKRFRGIKELAPKIAAAGKPALKKMVPGVKSTVLVPSGRISDSILLLRAVK